MQRKNTKKPTSETAKSQSKQNQDNDKSTKTAPLKRLTRDEKLFQNLLKITYEFIKGKRYSPLSRLALIERLQVHPNHLDIFDTVLKNLHEEGKIKVAQEMYLPHAHATEVKTAEVKTEGLVKGILKVHPRGFGFVEVQESDMQDIFIPKPYINGAVDGDLVEVLVNAESQSVKGPEGKVITIVERKHNQIVGIIFEASKNKVLAYCNLLGDRSLAEVIENPKTPSEISSLVVGDRVLLDVVEWGSKNDNTKSYLAKKIGHISDPTADIPVAILENNIRKEFPIEAQNEALAFGDKVTKNDLVGREDLHKLECFTIDPDTAKDYDDAISCIYEDGRYILGIHIADVSHYVKANSHLDIEAKKRCNSTYFPGTCIPMLPFELSDNLCSLKQGVLRLTVSVFVTLDEQGNIVDTRIVRSVIKSAQRFTYKQAKEVLDGKKKSKHKNTLLRMLKVCQLLKEKRKQRGSVELYMPELVIRVDKNGVPTGTELVEYDITHQMVEEFMLLANETVAKQLAKEGKELTYRVHEEPSKESLREFSALTQAFGFKLSPDPTQQEIQQFFAAIEGTPFAQYLSISYIRSMRLACYSADNIGHYGLSLEYYCHFTSPIRRYVDVISHRLLFEKGYDKKVITDICKQASEKERISARAESSVLALKKLRLLDKLVKEKEHPHFEAVVTRVKPFGIFFDVLELMFEGFLHISELDNDYFIFDERTLQLKGRHHHGTYRASDKLYVGLRNIDFITQEATWYMVSHDETATKQNRKEDQQKEDPRGKDFLSKKRKPFRKRNSKK